MITVFGAPPTRALRVLWMLEEMGLPYEVHSVDFPNRFQDQAFIDASPTGSFPAIRDGEVRMMESVAIMEYLGARYGPTPLAPMVQDPSYPTYMSYLHFGEASLTAPMNVTVASRFFGPDDQKQNWGAQFAVDNCVRKSAALLARLREGPFVTGETFTAADISCGYPFTLAQSLGFAERLDPVIQDYLGRLSARPAFQRAQAKGQTLGA